MHDGDGDRFDVDAALGDAEGAERFADPKRRAQLVAWARELRERHEQLEREHADLEMLHEATLEHANEIEEELALKIEEVESLVRDLEVRNGFIRAIFGRYLSDDVVTTLLEKPEALRLGGERRKVTILITDLRGFSAISERLDPEQVVKLLNIYLGSMAQVIDSYEGSINEFIGDAILTVFGAPLVYEDAAERAVACALSMQLEMERVNEECAKVGLPQLEMGVGVHTGEVIVGNIGSKKRTKYGLVGRNVNLASRVETYTVGGQVLISEVTAAEIGDRLRTRGCFQVKPKGFKDEITIYDVLGIDGAYTVTLPEVHDEARPLPRGLAVRVTVVDGKDVGGKDVAGFLDAVGENTAILRVAAALDPRVNVKLDFAAGITDHDVYAKVLGLAEPRPGDAENAGWSERTRHRIRFTPTPDGLIAAIRSAAASS
ncbi:MAG: hypothetical protein KC486_34115 [Myxococcales bacterium]|nr:hypothetical protein [Myxococcales bacterium]